MAQQTDKKLTVDKLFLYAMGAIIIVLLLVLVFKDNGRNDSPSGGQSEIQQLNDGETVTREELVSAGAEPTKPELVGNENRFKEVAQVGKIYQTRVTAEVTGRAQDKSWGKTTVINLTYASEALINRTVEENDGKKTVILYHFDRIATLKALSEVEAVRFNLGKTERGILATAINAACDGAPVGTALVTGMAFAEKLLTDGVKFVKKIVPDKNMKFVTQLNSLSGKKVRITYVDGTGVTEMAPDGCDLTSEQQKFILNLAPLGDFNIMPDTEVPEGSTWKVDAASLHAMLDPSFEGRPSGSIILQRGPNIDADISQLEIKSGDVEIDSSNAKTGRMARFAPTGQLEYNIAEGYVQKATLSGSLHVERFSKDHILFETRFKTRPEIKMTYDCSIAPADLDLPNTKISVDPLIKSAEGMLP